MAASRTASAVDSTARTASGRLSFAQDPRALEVPNLLALQTESFDWLLGNAKLAGPRRRGRSQAAGRTCPTTSGLEEIFEEISPIEDFSGSMSLSFRDHRFEPPKYSIEECKERDMTYSAPLFVTAEFMNTTTGEIKSQTVFMGDFPLMTERGTFVINGTERVVVSQLVRSPGRLLRAHRRQDLRQGHLHREDHPVAAVPGSSSRSTSATWSASASTASASSPSPCCSRRSAGPRRRSSRSSATYESMRADPGEGPHRRPGRRAARHLPQAAPGRAADARGRPDPAGQPLLQPQALRPGQGRPLQDQQEARPRAAAGGRASLTIDDIVATIKFLVALHAGETTIPGTRGGEDADSASRSTTSTTSATAASAPSAS